MRNVGIIGLLLVAALYFLAVYDGGTAGSISVADYASCPFHHPAADGVLGTHHRGDLRSSPARCGSCCGLLAAWAL
jgi:hypothetical protein